MTTIPPIPCPSGGIPSLKYEPGCWYIECERLRCKCRISDGDNSEPDEIVKRWNEEHPEQ